MPDFTTIILGIFAFPTIVYIVMYSLPELYMKFRPVPDLKKRYNAEWALVTGAGSGIGKSLVFKLAKQGLNVVVVSLDDDFLKNTMKELKQQFPNLEFRSVGVNFAPGTGYMDKIKKATDDIFVQIIFSNAGFLASGFFEAANLQKLNVNMECNATAGFNVAHHFVSKMVVAKKKGCLVFTSSVAGFIPTPFSGAYSVSVVLYHTIPLPYGLCAIFVKPILSHINNSYVLPYCLAIYG
jgi:NADP-dependent 3-hydroxy acid dehydrogenase YdfG